jgi:hypothetical protein
MLGQFLVGVVTVLSGSRTLRMLTVLLGCPQLRESGSKVLIHPNAHRNRSHHRHQRGPQKLGELSLPVPIYGIGALMSPRPLEAIVLGDARGADPTSRPQRISINGSQPFAPWPKQSCRRGTVSTCEGMNLIK